MISRLKRKRNAGLSGACLAIGLSAVALAAPASAAITDCGRDKACLWGNRAWDGGPYLRLSNAAGLYDVGYFNNDETSSVYNHTNNVSMVLFEGSSGSGSTLCVPRNYYVRDLNDAEFDDTVSSVRLTTSSCPSFGTYGTYRPY